MIKKEIISGILFILIISSLSADTNTIGIIPHYAEQTSTNGVSFLDNCVQSLRVAMSRRDYSVVSSTGDEELELILEEWSDIGDTGKKPLYQKISEQVRADEFIILTLNSSNVLNAEWRGAGNETMGGGSIAFITLSEINEAILTDIMRDILIPQLLNEPSPIKTNDKTRVVSFFLPGFGQIAKGHYGSGIFYGAAGAGLLVTSIAAFVTASNNYDLSEAPENTTNQRDYYYDKYTLQNAVGITAGLLLLADMTVSGLHNLKLIRKDYQQIVLDF
jgi:hypothetical protein